MIKGKKIDYKDEIVATYAIVAGAFALGPVGAAAAAEAVLAIEMEQQYKAFAANAGKVCPSCVMDLMVFLCWKSH